MESHFNRSIQHAFWLFRIISLPAELIHGLGHALMLAVVFRDTRWLAPEIVFEGRSFSELLCGRGVSELKAPIRGPLKIRIVSLGGIFANGLTLYFLLDAMPIGNPDAPSTLLEYGLQSGLTALGLTSFLCALSLPDWIGILLGRTPYWACGPAFVIRHLKEKQPTGDILSPRSLMLAELLAREASTRGGQSGGFSILSRKKGAPSIIFDKVVKGKREDIVRILMDRVKRLLGKAERERYQPAEGFEAILMHLRYATGGATHWHNAQPHWFEHYDNMIHHRVVEGRLESRPMEVFNMIAHNGDMDGVYLEISLEGQRVRHYFTQGEARAYFTRAMPWSSSKGNSDSRSVAEWVDFHLTQGLSLKSLRFAWFTAALDFNRDIASNSASEVDLEAWAEEIDLFLIESRDLASLNQAQLTSLEDLPDEVKDGLRLKIFESARPYLAAEALDRFVDEFMAAFFTHNLAWVMRRASRDLVGEFALMVSTTLEPRMGVFCLTQAFSIGYNRTLGEVFGSAEPQGVTSALQSGDALEEAHQIYLKDGQYALIEYLDGAGLDPVRIFDRALPTDLLIDRPACSLTGRLPEGFEAPEDTDWFPVNGNPRMFRLSAEPPEKPVQKDLQEIPYILSRIRSSFESGGENMAPMKTFSAFLIEKLRQHDRQPDVHDLVLYGVDFNQDLLQEFAHALRAAIPGLRVRAENSGNVLKEMKRTQREGIGAYGKETIFLGVSNSAQTQSTLAVVRKAGEYVGRDRCFVLTQTFLNSMSEALGQKYHPDAPLLPNTFVNLSHLSPDGTAGRRRAEAATIVIAATQAVLTEILINLIQSVMEAAQADAQVRQRSKAVHVRSDLNAVDIRAFREFQAAIYDIDIPNRLGFNAEGNPLDSPDHDAIVHEAEARAENQVEFVRAYAFFAAYIVFATVTGLPLFGVLLTPVSFIPGIGFFSHLLDAALFLTSLWLIHLAIRKWQGRPVFERIGARSEVFIDRRYIARIVERYNATLFSNAPAFITPFFYWADTVQDALHRYGIRAHRGVVTVHRTPDERMGIEEANNASEENMVYAQLGGIRFNGGEPQSRDKVRKGSRYEDSTRPYQTVLSDSLTGLRAKYDGKISSEAMRLINRRLIDLSDGLITEFRIGFLRKEIVNQSVWSVIRWLPGIEWIYDILLAHDIDLKNLAGDADTANQAQIQSTKHPVSPMDSHVVTMQPRTSLDAIQSEACTEDQSFAVLAFSSEGLGIQLNHPAFMDPGKPPGREIRLRPLKGKGGVNWIGDSTGVDGIPLRGRIERRSGRELLVIDALNAEIEFTIPLASLGDDQRRFLLFGEAPDLEADAA